MNKNKIVAAAFAAGSGIVSGILGGSIITYSIAKSTYKNFAQEPDGTNRMDTWSDAITQGIRTDIADMMRFIKRTTNK